MSTPIQPSLSALNAQAGAAAPQASAQPQAASTPAAAPLFSGLKDSSRADGFSRFVREQKEAQKGTQGKAPEVGAAEAGKRKGGVAGGIAKGLKYAVASNLVTIPLGLIQFPLALISGGLGCGTGLATMLLGPLVAGAIGFLKGVRGK